MNAVSEFFCLVSFVHAEWIFAELYAKIANQLKSAAEHGRKMKEEAEVFSRPAAVSQMRASMEAMAESRKD